ncbi:MAG: AarF/ABC1/UbiB kinase family protein, partial [Rhodospirillales bacterium]|nr:AarF/ABC1/UbiB kinase family protein [Rhodospirillales bacterium]
MNRFSVSRTLRGTRRAAEVISVLARYGLEQALTESGIIRLIERGQAWISSEPVPTETREQPVEVRLRMVLEELGPTFIKLGQILSTRPDLIPPRFANEFRKLQAECPTISYEKVRERLDEEFGERLNELFTDIVEEPVAAGSIAQVHRAMWHDGSPVVVKVLRPGVERTLEADMDVLHELAQLTERYFSDLGYSPTDVVREFRRELHREVDMANEGRATDRLAHYFRDHKDVSFPQVYWEGTTNKVLTLEHIDGTLLSDLDVENLTDEQRQRIVAHGADAVFKQCFEFGFFHADPHPANIFVLDHEHICFIDCGMTGHIENRTMQQLAQLFTAVIEKDLETVIRVTIDVADADANLRDDRAFRNDAWLFITRFDNATIEGLDMPQLLDGFFELLRRHHVRCPSDLVFLIKSITTIQGVGQEIAPDFDLMTFAKPYVKKLIKSRYSLAALRERFQQGVLRYGEFLEDLPDELRDLLEQIRKREFIVNLHHKGVDRLNDNTIDHAARSVSYAMIIAGLLVGSSILVFAGEGLASIGLLDIIG